MRKAILTKFIHLLFLALVLNTFIALVVTSSVLLKRSREDMHFALESVDRMLDYTGNVEEQLMDLSDLTNDNNSRYTLIRMDGTVVADTEVAQVNQMENHLERKEVKDALATGYGYSVRRPMNRWRTRRSVHRTANTYCAFLPVQPVWVNIS